MSLSSFDQLRAKAIQWRVELNETRETASSVLGFGERDGAHVVLKITKQQHGDEAYSGRVLRAFAGDGAVRVHEFETGAVLLERVRPGEQLLNLVRSGNDEDATKIIAHVIAKLANHTPPEECPTVADWGRGFGRYLESGDRQLPPELVHKARELYQTLATSQRTTMLLHGDLQHYNVLCDKDRGWVAIDPKGVIGELEYEVGAMLRNPMEQPELFTAPATISTRLGTMVTLLELDYSRAVAWSFAQSVLSAIWDVEDGYSVGATHCGLRLAHAITPLLGVR